MKMKSATYNIRQRVENKLKQKQGYTFRLPYPKRFLFAVAKEENTINSYVRWVVSEYSTGFAIAFGRWDGTRKAAIARAQVNLNKVGARELKRLVDIETAAHGKAN